MNDLPYTRSPDIRRAPVRCRTLIRFPASLVLLLFPLVADEVRLREESLTLPTYGVGEPDRNPRFYQGRTYQGARGQFYPYPVQDHLTGQREDRNWQAVYLENEYVEICILPEFGGRIFSAARQDQRLRLLLPPARDQAGADRHARRLDLRRRRVEHPAPPPGVDLHAGGLTS